MPGPLSKYRIIDLSTMISGPYATQLLGDQGADIIKVEPLSGDLMRHAGPSRGGISSSFLLSNRSKRSISMDLKQESGKQILRQLISTADVFVQNFRPGVIDKMGFGEKQVRALKENIVYVSISGFGATGPHRHKRVYDPLIQAMSGIMVRQGLNSTPRIMRTLIPDKLTAVVASQAITAALLGRENSGKGDHVSLSMLDATVAWMWPDGMINDTIIGEGVSAPIKPGAYYKAFETTDDYIMVLVVSDDEWQGFIRASGREELLDDQRFSNLSNRLKHFKELFDIIRATVKTATTEEWLAKLDAEDVPCARVNSLQSLLTDPQVEVNELINKSVHPAAGEMCSPRPAACFQEHSLEERCPAPMLGQHTEEILTELGIDGIENLRKQEVVYLGEPLN